MRSSASSDQMARRGSLAEIRCNDGRIGDRLTRAPFSDDLAVTQHDDPVADRDDVGAEGRWHFLTGGRKKATSMWCSMIRMLTSRSSRASRMKRAMYSFSSWFIPRHRLVEDEKPRLRGERARASSTRFCNPVGITSTHHASHQKIDRR
jgi:hypothetical protein